MTKQSTCDKQTVLRTFVDKQSTIVLDGSVLKSMLLLERSMIEALPGPRNDHSVMNGRAQRLER